MFSRSAREAVRDYTQLRLSDAIIDTLLEHSRTEFGDSFSWFAAQGCDQEALHRIHHENLDPAYLQPQADLIRAFRRTEKTNINHVILSHGHMVWTKPGLERCGLKSFFPDEKIITAEQINFLKKHEGEGALLLALEQLGLEPDPQSSAFVDDKAANLRSPKENLGWRTYLVGQEPLNTIIPSYVDVRCEGPVEVINTILQRNNELAHRDQALVLAQ